MLYLTISDKNKVVKFTAKGCAIRETYTGELCTGDKISIRLDGTNMLAVQLDPSLKETFILLTQQREHTRRAGPQGAHQVWVRSLEPSPDLDWGSCVKGRAGAECRTGLNKSSWCGLSYRGGLFVPGTWSWGGLRPGQIGLGVRVR